MITEFPVAPGVIKIEVGDVVCMTPVVPQVRRAALDILQFAKTSAIGIALSIGEHPANPNVAVATAGDVDKAITGLPAGAISIVIVDPATGRLKREPNPAIDDVQMGICDAQGNVVLLTPPRGIATTIQLPYFNIVDFGAVPNDSSAAAKAANSHAFALAQETMGYPVNSLGRPLFVPSGTFYLADDLHISKSLELFGTGIQGESILMFPPFKSLIIDPGNVVDPALSGADSMIRDLQIISEENWTTTDDAHFIPVNFDPDPDIFKGASKGTPGIKMRSPATIQRVYIKGFTGTGIYILGGGGVFNVNTWRIHDVYINKCGGHGIHVSGKETSDGLCTGAKMLVIGGSGINHDDSSSGNCTYVGCDAEVTKGRGYVSGGIGQMTFVGCFSEANEDSRLSGRGQGGRCGVGWRVVQVYG